MKPGKLIWPAAFLAALAAALLMPQSAQARIKLVTVPERSEADLRLDRGEWKLVEERRTLTLTKGANQVDFSWEGVTIDPGSLLLTPLDRPAQTRVVNMTYPPNVASSVVWEIYSERDGEENVSISYLIYNLQREIHYEAKVDKAEKRMDLKLYGQIVNDSGEDYDRARFRQGFGEEAENGIESGEIKKFLTKEWKGLPVEKIYRFEPGQGEKARMHYRIQNAKTSGLGDFALPAGKARVYQDDGWKSTLFLGEDRSGNTPVGGRADLFLAVAEDVKIERRVMSDKRENERNADDGSPASYDRRMTVKYEIENFKKEPVALEIIERFDDFWELVSAGADHEKKDANTVEFRVKLPAEGKKVVLEFEVLWKNQLGGAGRPEGPIGAPRRR